MPHRSTSDFSRFARMMISDRLRDMSSDVHPPQSIVRTKRKDQDVRSVRRDQGVDPAKPPRSGIAPDAGVEHPPGKTSRSQPGFQDCRKVLRSRR